MANDVPGTLPAPDIGLLLAGQYLTSTAAAPLGRASNWATAYNGCGTPRILQSFPLRGSSQPGDAIIDFTDATQRLACVWRIPKTKGATSVNCYVFGQSTGGNGEVEFKSVTGAAATGAQVIGATLDLYGPYALTIDASAGYDTIELYLDANAGGHMKLASVLVTVPAASSPLAAGTLASGCVGFDAGEMATDEPLASDQGALLIANAEILRAVPHVYWNWSSVDYMPDDPLSDQMRSVAHVMPCIVWADTERESWSLTVHVRASSAIGADRYVYVHAGIGSMPGYVRTLKLAVAGGTTKGWVTGTLRLPMRHRLMRSLPAGWETITLVVYPNPTQADAPKNWKRREGGDDGDLSTATIHSISVWGR